MNIASILGNEVDCDFYEMLLFSATGKLTWRPDKSHEEFAGIAECENRFLSSI